MNAEQSAKEKSKQYINIPITGELFNELCCSYVGANHGVFVSTLFDELVGGMKSNLEKEIDSLKKQVAVKKCMNCGNMALLPHGSQILTELKSERECADKLYSFSDHKRDCVNYDELPDRGFACECGYDSVEALYDQTQQQRKVELP